MFIGFLFINYLFILMHSGQQRRKKIEWPISLLLAQGSFSQILTSFEILIKSFLLTDFYKHIVLVE